MVCFNVFSILVFMVNFNQSDPDKGMPVLQPDASGTIVPCYSDGIIVLFNYNCNDERYNYVFLQVIHHFASAAVKIQY